MSHTAGMDGSGLPVPDATPLLEKLKDELVVNLNQEVKFQPNLHELSGTIQVKHVTIYRRRDYNKEQ